MKTKPYRARRGRFSWLYLAALALGACDAVAEAPPALDSLAPEVDCDGCYVVNAAISGAGGTFFVGGYRDTGEVGFVRQFDGEAWGTLLESAELGSVGGVWAASEEQVYLVAGGGPKLLDLESRALTELEVDGSVISGSGPGDVFVLEEGLAHHFDGSEWRDEELDIGAPVSLATASDGSAFALGSEGRIAQRDGEAWTPLANTLQADFQDLWAGEDGELVAVAGSDRGDDGPALGLIARFDGEAWHEEQDARGDALLGIAGASRAEIYAVGASRDAGGTARPVVWHFDGERWSRHEFATGDAFLWDAFCEPDGACYAVGTDNTVLDLGEVSAR